LIQLPIRCERSKGYFLHLLDSLVSFRFLGLFSEHLDSFAAPLMAFRVDISP
jgi:hypothetical protein